MTPAGRSRPQDRDRAGGESGGLLGDWSTAGASWRERRLAGRALRKTVPRSAHADDGLPADRDPIGILQAQAAERVPDLVGIRHARMAVSPFAYLRGAAAVMAADLAATPVTGPRVQLCGDAHIRNFGTFATPERNLTFSINDFDETLPGPWEWDVKRFAASLHVVATEHGFAVPVCRGLVAAAVRAYRQRMHGYARMPAMQVFYDLKGVDDLLGHYTADARSQVKRDLAAARRRGHRRAIAKRTTAADDDGSGAGVRRSGGAVRFREDPPIQVHLEAAGHELAEALATYASYRDSVPDDKRVLLGRYQIQDVARRVVGVGSVGTLVWVCLLEAHSRSRGDRLLLQCKQAQPSVLEPYLQPSPIGHAGRRVVAGQRLTQGPTDTFLGWCTAPGSGRQYYVRQLWDRKGRSDLTTMSRSGLTEHATLCAWALARAHARSGDAAAISGYLGRSDVFDRAIAAFAERYSACTARDHEALLAAIADGRLPGSDVT
jgi:uncharacterized protein (DUF2252 family)